MTRRLAKKVLVVGWSAADWSVIDPLLGEGLLPALQRLLDAGARGSLAALDPVVSPMLWTSIATGKRPEKHGVLGFVEPDPGGIGVRPATSPTRRVKALWNILTHERMRANVVGWPATHPPEPIGGVCVTDQFDRPVDGPWPFEEGAVHPERLERPLGDLRVDPNEIRPTHILPFVPEAAKVHPFGDAKLAACIGLLAHVGSVHAAATHVAEHEPWDFMAVAYDALHRLCHAFMPYHPPRMERIPEADFERYKRVVAGAYRYHDMMLERLLDLAGPEATVVLVSEHGFHSGDRRPPEAPDREDDGGCDASWHRRHGVICMAGPGVKKGAEILGASVLDVAPTILTLLGLPVGEDMDGRPLLEALDGAAAPRRIPSWEAVEGPCGMHPPGARERPWASEPALRRLADLGGMEGLLGAKALGRQRAEVDGRVSLARAHLDAGRPAEAAAIFEELRHDAPDDPRHACGLAICRLRLGEPGEARRLVDALARQGAPPGVVDLLGGLALLADGRPDEAIERLSAARADPHIRGCDLHIGAAHLAARRFGEAEAAFELSLASDGRSAEALDGIAAARLGAGRFEDAAEAALDALSLAHGLPRAHFHLGVALAGLGILDSAEMAFRTCLDLSPGAPEAGRWLARVGEERRRRAAAEAAP